MQKFLCGKNLNFYIFELSVWMPEVVVNGWDTWEMEASGLRSSGPAWATRDLVSKPKQNTTTRKQHPTVLVRMRCSHHPSTWTHDPGCWSSSSWLRRCDPDEGGVSRSLRLGLEVSKPHTTPSWFSVSCLQFEAWALRFGLSSQLPFLQDGIFYWSWCPCD